MTELYDDHRPPSPSVAPAAHAPLRVLVVEDDTGFACIVDRFLREEGFVVEIAHDGEAALACLWQQPFDAVILDVLLPMMDGREVCRRIRSRGSGVAILMTTALGELDNRIESFALGVDDYLVKPYSLAELLARLRAVLRRGQPFAPPLLQAGDVRLDTVAGRAWQAERDLHLSPREADLLELFLLRPGIALTRQTILAQVWGAQADPSPNLVDQYVGHLRRKLDHSCPTVTLQTIHGLGYRLHVLDAP